MSALNPRRKLPTILAVDVVDFSMLMRGTRAGHSRVYSIVTGRYMESYLALFISKIFQFWL